jgi:tetratricopeptide (TPR) repeat protein
MKMAEVLHAETEQLEKRLEEIGKELKAKPDDAQLKQVKVEILHDLGSNYMVLGRYADAEKHFRMLLEIRPYTCDKPAADPVGYWAQESVELCVQLQEIERSKSKDSE